MDAGTSHDMIEDLMVELAIVRSNLQLKTMENTKLRDIIQEWEWSATRSLAWHRDGINIFEDEMTDLADRLNVLDDE